MTLYVCNLTRWIGGEGNANVYDNQCPIHFCMKGSRSSLGVGVIPLATLSEYIHCIHVSPIVYDIMLLPPQSVTAIPGSEVLGEETRYLELRMQALREQEDSEVLHHAALLGNLSVIREYLDKYPNEVTTYIC